MTTFYQLQNNTLATTFNILTAANQHIINITFYERHSNILATTYNI